MALTNPRSGGPAKTPDSLQWLVDAYTASSQAKSNFAPVAKQGNAPRVDPRQQVTGPVSGEVPQDGATQIQLGASIDKPKPNSKFAFETKDLSSGSGSGIAGDDLVNIGGQSLKYLVPAARLLANERALKGLRKDSKLNLEKVKMQHGIVQDLQKPSFALRYRDPAGSSLQEMIGGQKFGDAQQREAERDWELQNSTSRIQQRQAINQSKNQENSVNTQITNAGRQYNTNMVNSERFMRMNNQEELELGLTETALNDLNQKNYLDASQEASAAADILRYGQPGTQEYNQALQYYTEVLNRNKAQTPVREFGGKLKRKTKLSYA